MTLRQQGSVSIKMKSSSWLQKLGELTPAVPLPVCFLLATRSVHLSVLAAECGVLPQKCTAFHARHCAVLKHCTMSLQHCFAALQSGDGAVVEAARCLLGITVTPSMLVCFRNTCGGRGRQDGWQLGYLPGSLLMRIAADFAPCTGRSSG